MNTATQANLLRRLADAALRNWQLAAALGSWSYRAPYPWEFELVNARFPRGQATSTDNAHGRSVRCAGIARLGAPACGCAAC